MLPNHFADYDPSHILTIFSQCALRIRAKALAPLRNIRTDACHVMRRGRVDLVFQNPKAASERFGKILRMGEVIHGTDLWIKDSRGWFQR